jgi:hypothetical protein
MGRSGAGERTRTADPIITNDVLYQLSYTGAPNRDVSVPYVFPEAWRFGLLSIPVIGDGQTPQTSTKANKVAVRRSARWPLDTRPGGAAQEALRARSRLLEKAARHRDPASETPRPA